MHGPPILTELVVLVIIAALGAAVFERLRLPSIAGFLVAGAACLLYTSDAADDYFWV